jgi:hypothetical protein
LPHEAQAHLQVAPEVRRRPAGVAALVDADAAQDQRRAQQQHGVDQQRQRRADRA